MASQWIKKTHTQFHWRKTMFSNIHIYLHITFKGRNLKESLKFEFSFRFNLMKQQKSMKLI